MDLFASFPGPLPASNYVFLPEDFDRPKLKILIAYFDRHGIKVVLVNHHGVARLWDQKDITTPEKEKRKRESFSSASSSSHRHHHRHHHSRSDKDDEDGEPSPKRHKGHSKIPLPSHFTSPPLSSSSSFSKSSSLSSSFHH